MATRLSGEALQPFHEFMADYCRRYASLQPEQIEGLWAEDAQGFGTGSDEWFSSRSEVLAGISRDFSELASVRIDYDRLAVFAG